MLAPFVLPFQITVAILLIGWLILSIRLGTRKRILQLTLACFLLFIPSCTGVMFVVDAFRYGKFEYATTGDIPTKGYIELPAAATNIVLHRQGNGHQARFSCDTESLRAWVEERRALRPDLNGSPKANEWIVAADLDPSFQQINKRRFAFNFSNTGWIYDSGMAKIYVSRSSNGGGYTIWHTPASNETYLRAGYW